MEYKVELHSFEEAPSTYSMSAADKKVRECGVTLGYCGLLVQ